MDNPVIKFVFNFDLRIFTLIYFKIFFSFTTFSFFLYKCLAALNVYVSKPISVIACKKQSSNLTSMIGAVKAYVK